jgi:excisionase family DNA binding protein
MPYIPERLWKARKEAGLTQEELAVRLMKSPATISKWEHGRTEPSSEDIEQLADALGKDWGYFTSDKLSYRERMLYQGAAMKGVEVDIDIGGRLVHGRVRGRGDRGEFQVVANRTGGIYYTRCPLLNYAEAAKLLGVGESTVRKLVAKGKLPCVRIGKSVRITHEDIEQLVNSSHVPFCKVEAGADEAAEGGSDQRWVLRKASGG